MSTGAGPVTADDVDTAVDIVAEALSSRIGADWHVMAAPGDWTCWETVEHICDGLFFYATQLVPVRAGFEWAGYPFGYRERRPGGPEGTIYSDPDTGQAGLVRILNSCGGLLSSLVRTAAPELRAHHMWGRSDREGFAAMGIVETLAHYHDIAAALDTEWGPPADLCGRVLARLFPDAPARHRSARNVPLGRRAR